MNNQLDITQFPGKRHKLVSSIEKAVADWNDQYDLPYKLLMTLDQYDMLKSVPQLGDWRDQRIYGPEDRVWITEKNAMDVRIAEYAVAES